MIYVIPHNYALERYIQKNKKVQGRLKAFSGSCEKIEVDRSYKIYILDSGAFVLSQNKRDMDDEYMSRLNNYYVNNLSIKKQCEKVFCIAPDKFLNSQQSMYNFFKWRQKGFTDVVPVLQASKKGVVDCKDLMRQADFYSKFTKTIFFSNPGLRGEDAKMYHLNQVFKYMKEELKVDWIHILGAGWSSQDIKDWQAVGYYDSMDSIAYYTEPSAYDAKNALQAINNIMEVAK